MKHKKIMIILMTIAGLILISLLAGKIISGIQFSKEVKELFSGSRNLSEKIYIQDQLSGLPETVQKYFKHVLKEGQHYISYARIKHAGQFKPGFDKDWTNITGEQYATTEKPGFIWKGSTSMFVARDMFIDDKGRLVVSLFSLYNIVDAKGEQYDQGELLRWLGESILYPTNLLPSTRLKWFPISKLTAKLTFDYNEHSLFFLVTFNETGEITQMETKRYMDNEKLETWIIKIGNYKEINNVIVPTSFEVLWRLTKGDFSYAKFYITEIEYDKAEKF